MAEARPEPSMEDILASIKRIISDDQSPLPQGAVPLVPPPVYRPPPPQAERLVDAPPAWPQRTELQPPESILELTDRIPVDRAPPQPLPERRPDPVPDRVAEVAPPLPPRTPPEPAVPPVQRAVERLRQAEAEMPQPAPRPVPRDLMPRTPTPRPTANGDVTLDALVREMLQPILADWVDQNLPDMVERLVQAEIRRMMEREA